MLTEAHLLKVAGIELEPGGDYAMVEVGASGRAGQHPSPRRGRKGRWKALGEFPDPDVDNARSFFVYQWVDDPPNPTAATPAPKESTS